MEGMKTIGSGSAEDAAGPPLIQASVITTGLEQGSPHHGSWGCPWVPGVRGGGPSWQESGTCANGLLCLLC